MCKARVKRLEISKLMTKVKALKKINISRMF